MKMSAIGWYDGITNADYHAHHAVSKSDLDLVDIDPASYIWSKSAPRAFEKMKALDFGTDFHAFLLEPASFMEKYRVIPQFNRKKPAEKEAEQRLMVEWKENGLIPITHEDSRKLSLMRESVMAHPTARAIMEMPGISERSFFCKDEETGINCRCRPDWLVDLDGVAKTPSFVRKGSTVLINDIKTTADIRRIEKSIEEFRYYVQDPFYSWVVEEVLEFASVDFVFTFVSTTIDCGRYPVRVVRLPLTAKHDGKEAYKKNLNTIASMKSKDDWCSIVEIDRPSWAINREEVF